MSLARIRVVAKNFHFEGSLEEKQKNDRILLSIFHRRVNDSGILTRYKERQYYESKGEKRRRKRKEANLQRMKDLRTDLREHFGGT